MTKKEKHWVLGLTFAFLVIALMFFGNNRLKPVIGAEVQLNGSQERGTFAVPVQLSRDSYGLAMFDLSSRTVWLYEFSGRGPSQNRLRLLAARTWKYDQLLDDYNTSPRPKEIKDMLDSLSPAQRTPHDMREELEQQAQPEDI